MSKNFEQVKEIKDQVNRLFEDKFNSGRISLSVDVFETDEAVVVTAPIYGLNQDTLDISISDGKLTISGETANPLQVGDDQYIRQELKFGAFSRTVAIPGKVNFDATSAKLKESVLTITIPKIVVDAPKVIKVTPA